MTVADPRYGAELVTSTGKVYTFDSIECLAAYVQENASVEVHSLWVSDYETKELVSVEDVSFLQSDSLKSPMSLNVAAFSEPARRQRMQDSRGGTLMDWTDVRRFVNEEWLENPSGGPRGMQMRHGHNQ